MAKRKKRSNNKWLQKARARMERKGTVGAFTTYCKRKGYSGVTQACINEAKREAKRTGNTTLLKRAVFAQNVKKIARKRKKK